MKEKNQYNKFLQKIQQEKMKELWDNESDEIWENSLSLDNNKSEKS